MALIHGAEFREVSEEEFLRIMGKKEPYSTIQKIPSILDAPPGSPSDLSKTIISVLEKPATDMNRPLKYSI